jgi:hypothetical protein
LIRGFFTVASWAGHAVSEDLEGRSDRTGAAFKFAIAGLAFAESIGQFAHGSFEGGVVFGCICAVFGLSLATSYVE